MVELTDASPGDRDFVHMVVRYLDGQISPEQLSQLNAELAADDSKRDLFVDLCLQGRLLTESLGSSLGASAVPPGDGGVEDAGSGRRPLLGFLADSLPQVGDFLANPARFSMLIAAAVIGSLLTLLAFSAAPLYRNTSGWREPAVESRCVARITRTIDCKWGDAHGRPLPLGKAHGERPIGSGELLQVGQRLELLEGLAEITFNSSARVVLQGPASFEPRSANAGRLDLGRLAAQVPEEARGFTVRTPTVKIVDLGTELGVAIDESRRVEAHVFAGRVAVGADSWQSPPQPRRELTAGQAVRVDASGRTERIDVDAAGFVRVGELPPPVVAENKKTERRWASRCAELRQDPHLVAHYTFQRNASDPARLVNTAATGPSLDGTIYGAQWVGGRWPGKDALRFSQSGDCVRLNVPGQFGDLTLAAWVCVDQLDNGLANCLLMCDGRGGAGRFHWQLQDDGGVRFGFYRSTSPTVSVGSAPPLVVGPGRWHHLAAVYDGATRTSTVFVDGQAAASTQSPEPASLVIGPAQIGCWATTTASGLQQERPLRGRIDELLILRRPLRASAIEDLYRSGLPPAQGQSDPARKGVSGVDQP